MVVPVYNEERTVRPFLERLEPVLTAIDVSYEILFCLDPSPDRSEQVIAAEIQRNPRIRLIVFSRRFGQPAATMAGIHTARGNVCVVIDVDLQDPPEVIAALYSRLQEGYEVVYARRRSRKGETLAKRVVSAVAYFVIHKLSDVDIPRDTGDFRIMTRRVVEELRRLNESHGFLRGMVAYVGFRQAAVEYDRDRRFEGKSHYNRLAGSVKIGMNGIVGFSTKPLHLLALGGVGIVGCTAIAAVTAEVSAVVLAVSFFAGVQLLGLGLTGEYIGRVYEEVRRRPLFIIDRTVNVDEQRT